MSAVHLDHDGTGYRVFITTNGLDKRYVGPRWATPKQAMAYSEVIERAERVSPLRESKP